WQKTNPADELNRIDMAMRCLLIAEDDRLILIDAGLGHKYDEKFARIYAVDHAHSTLKGSLAAAGFSPDDVTDLILTHLHFDHCGGATEYADGKVALTFPNAIVYLQKAQWETALHPNLREKASFFPENIEPLKERLTLLDGPTDLFPFLRLEPVHGHSRGQQIALIQTGKYEILYAADLCPTYGHVPVNYVMGYDVEPLVSMEERARYMARAAEYGTILFYEHDPNHECGTVRKNERGAYVSDQTFPLSELFS
ncbi:MAG: MBL fold metallo-hydrolase, partial [Bacteroidia bacterium]|nr:MBL fold metallo-hydrolase [Bacteroidia bacterium]